jgi:transcription elongation factor S-II
MDAKEMAPSELMKKRSKTVNDTFDGNRNDYAQQNTVITEGMFKCEECTSEKTSYFQMQIRGADEPMTS